MNIPIFSEWMKRGRPKISYIDQFPEPNKYGTRDCFAKIVRFGLEESKSNKAIIKLLFPVH